MILLSISGSPPLGRLSKGFWSDLSAVLGCGLAGGSWLSSSLVTCSATVRQSASAVMLTVTKFSQKNRVSIPGTANNACANASSRASSGLL